MSTTLAPSMADPARPCVGVFVGIRASEGEDWKVPSDHSNGHLFDDWLDERDRTRTPSPGGTPAVKLAEEAWQASITHHTATLRRVGWLDQRGRIWQTIPSGKDFDGGSLTPLLIDARD